MIPTCNGHSSAKLLRVGGRRPAGPALNGRRPRPSRMICAKSVPDRASDPVMKSVTQGTSLACSRPVPLTFFESLKQYVGFTDLSSAALRDLLPVARPHFQPIVDDFYAAIEAHPEARAAITGGAPQIARLKQTLIRWMDLLLLGPHDQAYYERRARIGRMHVRIALPQGFMFTAMNRIRIQLLDVVREHFAGDREAQPDRHRLESDPGPRTGHHAGDVSRGSGAQEPEHREAGHHRTVRGQHGPRAAQPAGRDGVLAVPAAQASGSGG